MCLFHKWSKWSLPMETYSGHKQQWRYCKKCGKADFSTLLWDKQTSIVSIISALKSLIEDTQS